MAELDNNTLGRGDNDAHAVAMVRVPSTRDLRISRLYAGVHRWSPTPAPARWTTASVPARPARSTSPVAGSQRTSSADCGGLRTRRITRCPSARRSAQSAEPIRPEAPVTAMVRREMSTSVIVAENIGGHHSGRSLAVRPQNRDNVNVSLLGEAVKIRREELRWGQEELARKVGVGQQTVSRWERGLSMPQREHVATLADVLGYEPVQLHRLAGFLPPQESSAAADLVHSVYARVAEFSDEELLLLLDRAWQEYRRRQGLSPPGVS